MTPSSTVQDVTPSWPASAISLEEKHDRYDKNSSGTHLLDLLAKWVRGEPA